MKEKGNGKTSNKQNTVACKVDGVLSNHTDNHSDTQLTDSEGKKTTTQIHVVYMKPALNVKTHLGNKESCREDRHADVDRL